MFNIIVFLAAITIVHHLPLTDLHEYQRTCVSLKIAFLLNATKFINVNFFSGKYLYLHVIAILLIPVIAILLIFVTKNVNNYEKCPF